MKRNPPVLRREVLALLAAASCPGAQGQSAGLGQGSALEVISFGGGFNLPLWAAREQGFFAQHGLAPQLNITADSKQVFTGLMQGRYHVAITAFDNLLAYQEGQSEIVFADPPSDFFAFMGSDDGFLSLVAAPNVASVQALRGLTVSVDDLNNGFALVLRDMLARAGLGLDDVKWARAGGTDRRFAALMQGQHAATMLRAPFDIQAKARGFKVLATTRSALGPYLGIVGAARRSWAQANPALVVGFIRAYRDAVRWLKAPANREAAQALLQQNVPSMGELIAREACALLLDEQSGFFSDVAMPDAAARAVLALRSRVTQRQLSEPEKYLDRRYWQQAMQA